MIEKHFIFNHNPRAPSCHCSTIVELPSGRLLTAWFAGTREKARDVAIWGASYDPATQTWGPQRVLAETPGRSMGSPVFYVTMNGTLRLWFLTMHHGRVIAGGWSLCTIKQQDSADEGETWSTPIFFRRGWFRVLRAKPLRHSSGRVLLPAHREMFTLQGLFFVNERPDLAAPWRRRGRLKVPGGCDEPAICELPDGTILCALRTVRAKRIYFSKSLDGGLKWARPWPSDLPNPNSQVDLICLETAGPTFHSRTPPGPSATREPRPGPGTVLMAFNNCEQGRTPLIVATSHDGGKTFNARDVTTIEDGPGEYSYPCLLQDSRGIIHLTYTWRRERIAHLTGLPGDFGASM